jgi:protein gp37
MSKIEWTEKTWNPTVGCSITSPGCKNCYAMKMASRIEAMNAALPAGHGAAPHYDGTTRKERGKAIWTGKIALAPESTLLAPLRRKRATTYFVNSMSDLFHEDVPDEWIDRVFAVMALSPQHTFQVLTKRAERMRKYFAPFDGRRADSLGKIVIELGYTGPLELLPWPLPNVWLGVSTERQQEYDARAVHLRETPAAVRFFSMEPLLGPIIAPWLGDWVIGGGESGHNAWPMHPAWPLSLRDQCARAGVPFFFKQWGEHHPSAQHDHMGCGPQTPDAVCIDGRREYRPSEQFRLITSEPGQWAGMCRVGKAKAGRTLDGILHDEYPQVQR